MALFNLSKITEALKDTDQTGGVSFVGLARKWEKEEDGKKTWLKIY